MTRGPSGLGLNFLGSQLALVTAFGSNVDSGYRASLRWTALYINGCCAPPMVNRGRAVALRLRQTLIVDVLE